MDCHSGTLRHHYTMSVSLCIYCTSFLPPHSASDGTSRPPCIMCFFPVVTALCILSSINYQGWHLKACSHHILTISLTKYSMSLLQVPGVREGPTIYDEWTAYYAVRNKTSPE